MAAWPYNTAAWKRLRKAKLHRDPLCEYCPAGTLTSATCVDHEKAISDGGDPFDWSNLRSACDPCHSRKTARGTEAGAVKSDRPMKGCNPDGSPLDPNHPWAA